jgi:colanic acid/amylovoran biosynthesis glycosyltransferase
MKCEHLPRMRVCVVRNGPLNYSETFIRQHVRDLPAETALLDAWPPWAGLGSVWQTALPGRAFNRAQRLLTPEAYGRRITSAYVEHFRRLRTEAVLAEFGPTGVGVLDACRHLGLPLVVHFHGYDASTRRELARYAAGYSLMFRQAAALVVVSHEMRRRLSAMGAPPERVHYNPCGVDCEQFGGAEPAHSPPLVLTAARFVEKKAPHLTLEAFAGALRRHPEARLRMIGDGPLLGKCRRLAARLNVQHAVTFLGRQPHQVVAEEMKRARLFAQHSVEAASGDVEGTPVAVLEAGATGLPVVSTRHGGIPDVVRDGETGLLVEEGDVAGMTREMLRLLRDPAHASALGEAARRHVREHYSTERSIGRLWAIIEGSLDCARR